MIFQVMQLSQSKQAKLEATLDLLLSQNQATKDVVTFWYVTFLVETLQEPNCAAVVVVMM
jgi:hypothetical protein